MVFNRAILSEEDIAYLSGLPEVLDAKIQLETRNVVYFSLNIPQTILEKINKGFGLNLSSEKSIPMRWIKGDTRPHVDTGAGAFENTYLIYLTDSEGSLKVEDETYPITSGKGYSFSERLKHETVGTGAEPRLLLGPMSEAGIAVGLATYLIQQDPMGGPGDNQYSSDGGTNWTTITWPFTIPGSAPVEFITDITLTSITQYFICGGPYIQFGSTSLSELDGPGSTPRRPVITITSGANNYPGLIQNGDFGVDGYNNIYVYNIEVDGTAATLTSQAGWIGQKRFGAAATDNYIVNCSSKGPINNTGCGGIVGSQVAFSSSGTPTLYIRGCSSTGNIGSDAGGIVGSQAGRAAGGNGGIVICKNCWSEGTIGLNSDYGGGIFGGEAGRSSTADYVEARNCYSIGSINNYSGGIFARGAQKAKATNCYSRGTVGTDGGGIFGEGAGESGTPTAENCYCLYGNIFGTTFFLKQTINCYFPQLENPGNSWSDSAAEAALTGTPTPSALTTWVSFGGPDVPYILNGMGYTPYSTYIIESYELIQSFSQTISAGESSDPAVRSGLNYQILQIEGGDPDSYADINIPDSSTGVITTTSSVEPNEYTVYVYNTGSYSITTFALTVTGAPPPPPPVISADGAANTVEIRSDSGVVQFRIVPNTGSPGSWTNCAFSENTFQEVENTSISPSSNRLKVIFTTDITLTNVSHYFKCGSDGIQFGSVSLAYYDGESSPPRRPVITVTVNSYDGLIENGDDVILGNNNIYIYNLIVNGTGYTTQVGAGWIGKKGFGNGVIDNYIVNCSASGGLPISGALGSGGIVGAYAGKGGTLVLYGCSSSVTMGQLCGGIVGAYAGSAGGSVSCKQCYFTGIISDFCGGIFGDYAGDSGYAEAVKCYTTGVISGNAGGIYGRFAGNFGSANAIDCYSTGNIGADGGGIFGIGAGSDGGLSPATNCYSSGAITPSGPRGIYGSGAVDDNPIHCYVANGSWDSDAANAEAALTGGPLSSTSRVGDTWISLSGDYATTPWILNGIGYTPLSLTIINSETSELIQDISDTTNPNTEIPTLDPSRTYEILQITGGDPASYEGIEIIDGKIFIGPNVKPGVYTITLYSTGSYNITFFSITVYGPGGEELLPGQVPCCAKPMHITQTNDYTGDFDYTTRNKFITGNTMIGSTAPRRTPIDYTAMYYKKMAYAAKR